MDRRAVPRDFEFVPKLRRTSQDPLAQSSVSPIAYVTRPHQRKMDEIPPGWLDWLGFYSFWLTHGKQVFGHFQPQTANSGHSRSTRAGFPSILGGHAQIRGFANEDVQ